MMERPIPHPFLTLMQKTRKASISSSSGTFDSSHHSTSILEDATAGTGLEKSDEPLVRQLRHNGTKFALEVHDRASKIQNRTILEEETENVQKNLIQESHHHHQSDSSKRPTRCVEDRFASQMNFLKTKAQLAQLRNDRRTHKAIVIEEVDDEKDDSIDKSLAKFWEREQKKSVHYVTCNLHHLVLISGDEDRIQTFAGYQYVQAMPMYDFTVASRMMDSCSA